MKAIEAKLREGPQEVFLYRTKICIDMGKKIAHCENTSGFFILPCDKDKNPQRIGKN